MEGKWKGLFDRIKGKGKNQWLVFLLLGALLLVIAIPVDGGKTEKEQKEENKREETDFYPGKAEALEGKLEKILREVEGVGQVKVALTLKSDGVRTVEKDSPSTERNTTEKNGEGNEAVSREISLGEETIFEKNGAGEEIPYVVETKEPEILGVLVAAQGADDPRIVTLVTEAAEALFNIEAHKIKVMKMN